VNADVLALRLSAEIDELASALAAAGPLGDGALRLLESAAVAAMHAVSLEELRREEAEAPRQAAEPAPVRPLRRAA